MLLAAVGQTPLASYAQHSSAATVAGTTSGKSKGTQNQHNLGNRNQQPFQARSLLAVANNNHNSFSRPTTVTAATAASSLMKTLSVRLHRGTEYIKDTVQRALVVSSAANAGCSVSTIPSTSAKTHTAGHRSSLQRTQAVSSTTALRSAVPSASFLKLYTVPPTALHRSTQARQNAGSTDSLLKELCHFKPIRPMPLTPIKMSVKPPGCDVKCPKAIYATHRFALKFSCDDTKLGSSSSNPSASPVVRETPMSTTILTTTPQHKSAFVCLVTRVDINLKPNTVADTNIKKTKRRRRNVFGLPRRRARQNVGARKAIVANDNVTIQDANPTPIIEPKSKTIDKASEQPLSAGKRKRKHVEALSLRSQSLKAQTIPLKTESQPSKKKRTRLTKDCQVDASNTEKGSTKKKPQQQQKSCDKGTAKSTPPKKNAAASSHNISRCSPPMTRQRARQISYNQSK